MRNLVYRKACVFQAGAPFFFSQRTRTNMNGSRQCIINILFDMRWNIKRKRFLLITSVSLFVAFIVLRVINGYGDPAPWSTQKDSTYTFLSFMNISKYPPSLMYCCITLSVGMLVLALTENASGKLTAFLKVYGSVPFFYYVLHFYLIRIITVLVFFIKGYNTSQIITPNDPFLFTPPGLGFNLGYVYLWWLFVILTLYYPCKWFSNYKKTHRQWWLSYL
ncbi:MAG: hypothetical protein JKY70_16865 [Mucilaginibacter sp.]|nr:hypothetical protein [Mucilaginibacter sp.]